MNAFISNSPSLGPMARALAIALARRSRSSRLLLRRAIYFRFRHCSRASQSLQFDRQASTALSRI